MSAHPTDNAHGLHADAATHLRILFFSDAEAGRNGVGTYYCDLVEHLSNHVEHAQLICPGHPTHSSLRGMCISLPGDPTQKLRLPAFVRLGRLAREVQPTVIAIATPGPYGLLGARVARRMKVPLCVGYHTQYDKLADLYWNRVFGALSSRYLTWLDRRLFKRAAVVIANCSDMAARARRLGAPDVGEVGTPVGNAFLAADHHPVTGVRHILFAGRLAPEKNLGTLLTAASELPDITFTIAGDGPLRRLVEGRAQELDNLHYAGWLKRDDLVDCLDRCDLLCLPSSVESFGTVALEAMARARPVLVSRQCGILEWPELARGIFAMEEGETLTDSIRRLAALPAEQLAERAERAHAAAAAFNAGTIRQWLDIFQRVITLRSAPAAPGLAAPTAAPDLEVAD